MPRPKKTYQELLNEQAAYPGVQNRVVTQDPPPGSPKTYQQLFNEQSAAAGPRPTFSATLQATPVVEDIMFGRQVGLPIPADFPASPSVQQTPPMPTSRLDVPLDPEELRRLQQGSTRVFGPMDQPVSGRPPLASDRVGTLTDISGPQPGEAKPGNLYQQLPATQSAKPAGRAYLPPGSAKPGLPADMADVGLPKESGPLPEGIDLARQMGLPAPLAPLAQPQAKTPPGAAASSGYAATNVGAPGSVRDDEALRNLFAPGGKQGPPVGYPQNDLGGLLQMWNSNAKYPGEGMGDLTHSDEEMRQRVIMDSLRTMGAPVPTQEGSVRYGRELDAQKQQADQTAFQTQRAQAAGNPLLQQMMAVQNYLGQQRAAAQDPAYMKPTRPAPAMNVTTGGGMFGMEPESIQRVSVGQPTYDPRAVLAGMAGTQENDAYRQRQMAWEGLQDSRGMLPTMAKYVGEQGQANQGAERVIQQAKAQVIMNFQDQESKTGQKTPQATIDKALQEVDKSMRPALPQLPQTGLPPPQGGPVTGQDKPPPPPTLTGQQVQAAKGKIRTATDIDMVLKAFQELGVEQSDPEVKKQLLEELSGMPVAARGDFNKTLMGAIVRHGRQGGHDFSGGPLKVGQSTIGEAPRSFPFLQRNYELNMPGGESYTGPGYGGENPTLEGLGPMTQAQRERRMGLANTGEQLMRDWIAFRNAGR